MESAPTNSEPEPDPKPTLGPSATYYWYGYRKPPEQPASQKPINLEGPATEVSEQEIKEAFTQSEQKIGEAVLKAVSSS